MRTAIVRIGLAAIAMLIVIACSDQNQRDPLSPKAPDKAFVTQPCLSIACQPQPNYLDVSAGNAVTCAIHSVPYRAYYIIYQSNLYCWGDNEFGMLGIGVGAAPETCTNNVGVNYSTDFKVPCSTKPVPVNAPRYFSSVS